MRAMFPTLLFLPFILVGCGGSPEIPLGEESSAGARPTHEARYAEDGQLIRPDNWREWIFVGMPVTPNALNGGQAILPEAQAVYVDPTSWEHWRETGTFREGTMFAVELTLLETEGAHEDGSTEQLIGRGFFQSDFAGLMFSVKDSERFAGQPGGWAYFSSRVGAMESEYPETMAALPVEACNACHATNGSEDWVFTQLYPVLKAAKPAGSD
jgi:hypothetical protein